jgi:Effector-associated domain 1
VCDTFTSKCVTLLFRRMTLDAFIPSRIAAGVAVFEALPAVDEHSFLRWMNKALSSAALLDINDSEAIGRLVLARKWTNATDVLLQLEKSGRLDVQAALRVCYSLLNPWSRLFLGLKPISSLEKWELLEEEATAIYSSGPDHNELWSRAGGDNSDLQHQGTGRSRWHNALGLLRAGKHPGVSSLIQQMRVDFPMNNKIAYLANDSEFGISQGRESR